jgi:hypothetical protein
MSCHESDCRGDEDPDPDEGMKKTPPAGRRGRG